MDQRFGFQGSKRRRLTFAGFRSREITLKDWPNITGGDGSPDGKGMYVGSASPGHDHSLRGYERECPCPVAVKGTGDMPLRHTVTGWSPLGNVPLIFTRPSTASICPLEKITRIADVEKDPYVHAWLDGLSVSPKADGSSIRRLTSTFCVSCWSRISICRQQGRRRRSWLFSLAAPKSAPFVPRYFYEARRRAI